MTVVGHRFPDFNGERTVVATRADRVSMTLPVGHPRYDAVDGSWVDTGRAGMFTANPDGTVTVLSRDGHGGWVPLLTIAAITLPGEAAQAA